ncbi:Bgt-1726 [Blumeria graminis f. sp. tritici]|uniref:Protein phosphatase methylesterase 1 n=2 Tax=Blumeria graminis f. sp. tritici TaxID=62690 RepID=A0A061HBR0_BLUGR|nr:hypothetical protein BGT96224_1726 [Blumeria graminis f. sp. tritici 96224]VDB90730.1 Bgt-1726 [Blumeria graminis f. sp. tritici]
MVELRKAFAKPKFSPFLGPQDFYESGAAGSTETATTHFHQLPPHSDDDSLSESSISSACTIKPPHDQPPQEIRPVSRIKQSITPIPWTNYFEREIYIQSEFETETILHHGYLTCPVEAAPLFVTHHGAGSSGLSFATLFMEIRKQLPMAGILSIDARDHGLTRLMSTTSKTVDLSLATLSLDLFSVIENTKIQMGWKTLPPVVLLGHSLGGAVVTELGSSGKLKEQLLGYVVLDVVEGSALDALNVMKTYLSTRPTGFPSLEAGIAWHLRSQTIRNPLSARISVPALLVHNEDAPSSQAWTWRTDLSATEPFWKGWFVGLSKSFLAGRAGKLLLLAGTDRLDKELLIGQMQGKYTLHIFPETGHFIHEDAPDQAAMKIVEFYRRNDRSLLVLPPKVSDLLLAGKKV